MLHTEAKFPHLIRRHSTLEKGHGRLEERTISVLATHNTSLPFKGVKQVARLHRKRDILKNGKSTEETLYLITNLDHNQADPKQLLELKREYWSIENKLHYRKDFVFGEDRSTIRKGHGPENMSALRNFAVSLLMANNVANVKRCVENMQYEPTRHFYRAFI